MGLGLGIALTILLLLFPSSQGTAFAQAPTVPPGILAYVPVTITNSQPSPTPAPFQEMFKADSAAYSVYEAPNLQNVEFFDSAGNVIPSWLESGSSNSATTTIYWLNIDSGVQASSKVTVYMGFAVPSMNLLNNRSTGEAPELSPSYGRYDDGAFVFQFYDNFAGTHLNGAWDSKMGNGTYSVSDGLTLTYFRPSSVAFVGSLLTKTAYSPGVAFDAYIPESGTGSINMEGFFNVTNPVVGLPYTGIMGACVAAFPEQESGHGDANGCGSQYGDLYQGPGESGVYSIVLLSSSSSMQYFNYSVGQSHQPISTYAPTYPLPAGFAGTNTGNAERIQWARIRASPPGGEMPAAIAGSVVVARTEPSVTVTCSPSTVTVNSATTCSALVTGSSPTGTITWSTSGIGTFTPSYATCVLASGTCSVSYKPTSLTPSSVTIAATYEGDLNNLASSGNLSLGVAKPTTTTTVSCSPSPVANGSSSACTASVAGSSPTGTVTWASSGVANFSAQTCTLSNGACSVNYTAPLAPSTVAITASYEGDSNNEPSSGTFSLVVSQVTTSTSTSTSIGGGGIPEFPYQLTAIAGLTVLVVAAYLLVRRRGGNSEVVAVS